MSYRVVFHDCNSPLQVEDKELPPIHEGEVLAKIKLATICGSDLHTIAGKRWTATPSVLGHEAVVEVVHSRRDGLKPGDCITFSVIDCCKECDRCSRGLEQKCRKLFKYGHSAMTNMQGWSGCYASHIVLHQGTFCVQIPGHIPDSIAAPINCAVATVVNAVSQLPSCAGKNCKVPRSVLIQGAGMLGLYSCALLKERGYQSVYCTDFNEERLKLSLLFGGTPLTTGSTEFEHIIAGQSFDAVIEVCGVISAIPDGVRALRPGGTYLLVGLVHPDSQLPITAEQIIKKCLTIKGIHNYSAEHLHSAVKFISETVSKYPYGMLISPSFSLRELPEAIKAAQSQQYLRVSVVP